MHASLHQNCRGVLVVIIISFTAWPLVKVKDYFPFLTYPRIILIFGSVTILSLYVLLSLILPPEEQKASSKSTNCFNSRGLLYYWCGVSAWSCMIDFVFFLEVNGNISGFMDYYLETGEPYFNSPYGALALLWDAGPHYFLYLQIIYMIDSGKNCKNVVLVWCGFMIPSVFTIFFGALSGRFSKDIHPASFLNIPYAVLPAYFAIKALVTEDPGNQKNVQYRSSDKQYLSLNAYFAGLCGSILLLLSALVNWVRAMGSLGSYLPIAHTYAEIYEPYLLDDTKFGSSYVIFSIHIGTIFQVRNS